MNTEEDILEPLTNDRLKLLVENHKKFQGFLQKRVGDKNTAEDLLQQSLKKAVENPPTSQNELSVLAWFYQVLRNTLTDYYRSQAAEVKKNNEFKSESMSHQPIDMEGLEASVCECMKSLLPTLKPDYAELLRRIDLGSETAEQLSKEKRLTRNSLDVKLHRARQALKLSLERTCGACTEHGCLNCTCS